MSIEKRRKPEVTVIAFVVELVGIFRFRSAGYIKAAYLNFSYSVPLNPP